MQFNVPFALQYFPKPQRSASLQINSQNYAATLWSTRQFCCQTKSADCANQQRATVAASNTFMKRRSPVRYHTLNGFKQSLHVPAVKYLQNNFTQKYLLKKH